MRMSSSSTLAASNICRIAATIAGAAVCRPFPKPPVYLAKGIKSTHADREGEHIAHSTAFRPARGLILNT